MKDILEDIATWRSAGRRIAVAGSVSGGCVEGAVVSEAQEVLGGGPARLVTYDIADEDAFAVGLACGGTIHVLIESLDWWPLLDILSAALAADEPVALATVVVGSALGTRIVVGENISATGSLGDPRLDEVVGRDALGQLDSGVTGTRHYGLHGEARTDELSIFIESFAPAPRLIIFGAVDFTAALAYVAKRLGYRVTVCDARPVFATRTRFPSADEVVVEWPDAYLERVGAKLTPLDAICVLTHHHNFDVPAILGAVATRAGYIGAMGSRRTTRDREQRLLAAGIDEQALRRVKAPIGLDIGARTPAETAVSICAEIIASRTGHDVPSLRGRSGPIHPGRTAPVTPTA